MDRTIKISVSFLLTGVLIVSTNCLSKKDENLSLLNIAVSQYHVMMIRDPYLSPAAYLEKATCEEVYCMYTEAYGYLHSSGYNADIPVDNFAFLSKNMKKSNRSPLWLESLEPQKITRSNFEYISDYSPGYNQAFSAFRFFEQNGPLSNFSRFEFEITDTLSLDPEDGELIIVQFQPTGSSNYRGSLQIHSISKKIEKITLDQMSFYSNYLGEWTIGKGQITYKHHQKYSYVSNMNFEYRFGNIRFWVSVQSLKPLVIWDEIDELDFQYFAFNDRNPFVYYKPEVWHSDERIEFKQVDYALIKNDMEVDISLNEQFQQNSEKPFLTRILRGGSELHVDGGQETYRYVKQRIAEFDEIYRFYD